MPFNPFVTIGFLGNREYRGQLSLPFFGLLVTKREGRTSRSHVIGPKQLSRSPDEVEHLGFMHHVWRC